MSSADMRPSLYPKPANGQAPTPAAASYPPPPAPPSFDAGPPPQSYATSGPHPPAPATFALSTTSPASTATTQQQEPQYDASAQQSAPLPHQASKYAESFPPEYEIILEIDAHVQQIPAAQSSEPHRKQQPVIRTGTLRVIQGPLPPSTPEQTMSSLPSASASTSTSYHAFISIDDVNIPLVPAATASRVSTGAFYLTLPNYTFTVQPNTRTEPELMDSFEHVLRWFCSWQILVEGQPSTTLPPVGSPHDAGSAAALNKKQSSVERIAQYGDRGVEFVERIGNALNLKITTALDKKRNSINEDDARNVKLGGKITATLLSTTRTLVGVGAGMASKVTEKVSSKVGGAIGGNRVSRSMADAPEGSNKRTWYDNLMAGFVAFGRIYVEADHQGRMILESSGHGASEIARKKYGSEAEMAARNVTGIAIDSYRISRFPAKLGATSIIKGAFKSKLANKQVDQQNQQNQQRQQQEQAAQSGAPNPGSSQQGTARYGQSYFPAQVPPAQAHPMSQFRDISDQ